jgi:5-methylcytosine-specific restriction endonuclease McrA
VIAGRVREHEVVARADVLKAFAYRCAECGGTGVPLDVHHRDHDAANNRAANLTVLCRPCHAKAGMRLR